MSSLSYKAKRRYLLTLQVNRYSILALQSGADREWEARGIWMLVYIGICNPRGGRGAEQTEQIALLIVVRLPGREA